MKRSFVTALMVGGMLATHGAAAHHSFAMFEPEKLITLDATVESVEWANPHIWINLVATGADGTPFADGPEKWGIETGGPEFMKRSGWTRKTLKPGDRVKATGKPMRDGSHAISLKELTLQDGTVLGLLAITPPKSDSASGK